MAEFQEVARHWKRMCNRYWRSTTCHGCPIAEHERCYEACSNIDVDISIMEEVIMKWAAEHPEPVYPSWREYLTSIGVIPKVDITPVGRSEYAVFGIDNEAFALTNTRISPDIAERLGIEPKEGT